MTRRPFALACLALFLAAPASAQPSERPIVIELFTSQGCSSCPPADALLQRLDREPGIIAISRPVTYWDRLGWKDTLALPANTALQRAYAARKLPGAGVYTPGAIVQGRYGAVGSNERKLRALIASARKAADGPALTVTSGQLKVASGTGRGTLQLLKLRPAADVAIGTGENGGRRIRYTNVLTSVTTLGEWRGAELTLSLPRDARSAGAAAVILRDGAEGPILAARRL